MTDHAALLRAILDGPEDEAPRLVYADWLDEHRDPDRAEFIRVQLRMDALWPINVARCLCGLKARKEPDLGSLRETRLLTADEHRAGCMWHRLGVRALELWSANARHWPGYRRFTMALVIASAMVAINWASWLRWA